MRVELVVDLVRVRVCGVVVVGGVLVVRGGACGVVVTGGAVVYGVAWAVVWSWRWGPGEALAW